MHKPVQVLPAVAIRMAQIVAAIDPDWSVWIKEADVRTRRGGWGIGLVHVHQNSHEPDHRVAVNDISARFLPASRLQATESLLAGRGDLCERYRRDSCAGPTICHECADLVLQACAYGSIVWE